MTRDHYKIGTLIKDMGKIGIIYRTIEAGKLDTEAAIIAWRFNYEIYYFDGGVTVMAHDTLVRLINSGAVEIVEEGESEYFIFDNVVDNE